MAIKWTDDLATGTPDIDDQHKELIFQINNLIAALSEGRARHEVEKMIQFMNEYVSYHFKTEEKYMDKFGYPNTTAHKGQHEVFVKSFSRLKQRYLQQGVDQELISETNDLIADWFVNHIRYVDRALGMFLKRKL